MTLEAALRNLFFLVDLAEAQYFLDDAVRSFVIEGPRSTLLRAMGLVSSS
jgi:hypothetical protein